MRALFILFILTAAGPLRSQSFTLPIAIVDSMLYEVERGRACGRLVVSLQNEVDKYQYLVDAQSVAIELHKQESKTKDLIIGNLEESNGILEEKVILVGKIQRKRGRKEGLIVGLSVGLLLLILASK